MTQKSEIRRIVDEAVGRIERVLTAPWPPDPAAPAGYLHVEIAEQEMRRRCRAAAEIARALPRAVGERFGPAMETAMTEAVEELVAMIEANASGPLN